MCFDLPKLIPYSCPPETLQPVTGLNIPEERRTTLHHSEDLRTQVRLFSVPCKTNLKVICLDRLYMQFFGTTFIVNAVTFSFTFVASTLRVHNKLPVCAQIMSIFLVDERFYLCDDPCPHVVSVCCHPRDFRSSRLVCHLFHLHLHKQ